MLVGVYLDKGRVSDTPESGETVISETLWRHFKTYKQTSYFQNRSLDLTLSDYPAGNPEYVQTTPAGHIFFGF